MNPNYQSSFGRGGAGSETRYSKDQLLDMFKVHEKNGQLNTNLNDLFMDGWTPGNANGNENGSWGKKDEHRESAGTDICWDLEGSVRPVSLSEMDQEEREVLDSLDMINCVGLLLISALAFFNFCQFFAEACNEQ